MVQKIQRTDIPLQNRSCFEEEADLFRALASERALRYNKAKFVWDEREAFL